VERSVARGGTAAQLLGRHGRAVRAGLVPVPRPYDLRHSFASLLLAEGRTVHYVATQLGHSLHRRSRRMGI